MKYELAVFDMDGTILDTLEDLRDSLNFALEQNGLPTRTLGEVRSFVGNGIRLLVERGVPEGTGAELTDKVFDDFSAHYKLHCADMTRPYDGIKEVISALRAAGVKTAVVSNKADFAVQELCRSYFPGLFDAAAGEQEGVRRKPAPDSVNTVIKALDAIGSSAVYIGDSEVDLETAKNAKLPCISVLWGFRSEEFLRQRGAKCTVSAPAELLELIL